MCATANRTGRDNQIRPDGCPTFAAIRLWCRKSREVTLKWPNDLLIDGAEGFGTLIESLCPQAEGSDVNSSAAALASGSV